MPHAALERVSFILLFLSSGETSYRKLLFPGLVVEQRETQSRIQTFECLTRMPDEIKGSGILQTLDDLHWSFELTQQNDRKSKSRSGDALTH